MKVEIFEDTNKEVLVKKINEFEQTHRVKATQYEPIYVVVAQKILYTAMVFYEVE